MEILLSVSTTPVICWIAQLLGWIMNGIYWVLDAISIPNVGLAIILYTVITYLLLTPIQIKQQKMSKMMTIIQPEIQKIRKSIRKKRSGISDENAGGDHGSPAEIRHFPHGKLPSPADPASDSVWTYQVIYHIPGYISKVANIFSGLAGQILDVNGATSILTTFAESNSIRVSFGEAATQTQVIDFLYMLKPDQWDRLADVQQFQSLHSTITDVAGQSERINSFLGINISQSPWDVIQSSISTGAWLLLIAAILVPVLAWFTQWLNYKLMPQQATTADNPAGGSMKMMNMIMPIFSAFICVTLSMGIGIYWIAGAVIRCIQQVVINRRIAKMDAQELLQKNQEKQAKKRAKKGLPQSKITNQAKINVRNIKNTPKSTADQKENEEDSLGFYNDNARPDSITAKANMVRQFDLQNSKKKK